MQSSSIEEITERLRTLQLEQHNLLEELIRRATGDTREETPVEIKEGDLVEVLTSGVRCRAGDKARVTKVKGPTVHLKVLRNSHNTYRKKKNVRKIDENEQ